MTQQKFTINQFDLGDKTKATKIESTDLNKTVASFITNNTVNKANNVPSFTNDQKGATAAVEWLNANSKHKFSIDVQAPATIGA